MDRLMMLRDPLCGNEVIVAAGGNADLLEFIGVTKQDVLALADLYSPNAGPASSNHGLWVWEGEFTWRDCRCGDTHEVGITFDGAWRPATDEEALRLAKGEPVWTT